MKWGKQKNKNELTSSCSSSRLWSFHGKELILINAATMSIKIKHQCLLPLLGFQDFCQQYITTNVVQGIFEEQC